MTKVIYKDRHFEIEPATLDDAVDIGEAHLQSWLETYPNEEYGVTEDWIRTEFGFLTQEGIREDGQLNGVDFRRAVIEKNNPNALYKVVKDENGRVQGFLHAEKTDNGGSLNAIYLTNELKGTGVARKMMEEAIGFMGDIQVDLQVVAYNERAISFYEDYGFERGEIEEELFHKKIPILNMKRRGSNEI